MSQARTDHDPFPAENVEKGVLTKEGQEKRSRNRRDIKCF